MDTHTLYQTRTHTHTHSFSGCFALSLLAAPACSAIFHMGKASLYGKLVVAAARNTAMRYYGNTGSRSTKVN